MATFQYHRRLFVFRLGVRVAMGCQEGGGVGRDDSQAYE